FPVLISLRTQCILRLEQGRVGRVGNRQGLGDMTELASEAPGTSTSRRLDIPRALLEESHEGIALIGADGVIQYANPAIDRALGYATNETVGKRASSLAHPDEQQRVENDFAELLTRPGGSTSGVTRWLCADGSWHQLQAT